MDYTPTILSFALSLIFTFILLPVVIKKMSEKGISGVDVNKRDKRKVAEMGGTAAVIGIAIALIIISLNFSYFRETMITLSVLFLVAFTGAYDDLRGLSQKRKAIVVGAASFPIILAHPVSTYISMPLGFHIDFPFYFYFLILVPIGISGPANALNMSAGYNGLESGEIAIISSSLLVISILNSSPAYAQILFSSILGASLALYYFNRYPARTFIGDVGTLSLGALLGLGTIFGKIEFYGAIAILPAFFELFSTVYHNMKGINRREVCMNPIILDDGRIKAPEGTKWYTIALFILSKGPLTEKSLVRRMLMLYALSGAIALALFLI